MTRTGIVITFAGARAIVARDATVRELYPPDDFSGAEYGWQNADEIWTPGAPEFVKSNETVLIS